MILNKKIIDRNRIISTSKIKNIKKKNRENDKKNLIL